jgi:signal recognition particle receptor subunit beta
MALINYANKEINAKIVYYGPGLSGKTTNIQYIFQRLKPEHRGKLITLPTQTDRTLFFDFLPVEIPDVKGFTTRFHLYTVPGQVFYNATRKMVLKGVDGIVFVADSQKEKLDDNLDSLKNLEENLNEYGKSIKTIPFVFQFNKRDLTEISSPAELNKRLNDPGYPNIEAIATTGKGVMETLSAISRMVLRHLKDSYESQKILRYDESRDTGAEQEEIVSERNTRAGRETPPPQRRPSMDFSDDEIVEPEELVAEAEQASGKVQDHLGVMGEYGETEAAVEAEPEETPEEAHIEVDVSDIEPMETPREAPHTEEPTAVDLVLGGEVERTGRASFRIPLTFRIRDIEKDVVLNISVQITDSDTDRDIF